MCRRFISPIRHAETPSARAYHRVLKLSRTIAGLAGDQQIAPRHLVEAQKYRRQEWGKKATRGNTI